ncbi:MAG: LicD family protein [Alistipes sp.]|nr:LicD family protein [Alistipes sp.]
MIDSQLQQELRERFNPDGSRLREAQLRILAILKEVDIVCKRNNIPYWLASGTLIGAVRHGGFIPWDDDLDIEILYSDKKRFMEACQRELPKKYKLQCHTTDKSYCLNILKVRDIDSEILEVRRWGDNEYPVNYKYKGYFVDVFTVERSYKPLIWISRIPIRVLSLAQFKYKLSPKMLSLVYCLCEAIYAILRLLARICPFKGYYYHSYGSWFMSKRVKSEMIPTRVMEFEDGIYSVPNNCDAYLYRIYGDYMELPDEKNMKPSHDITL